jgi:S1-C subfamily serine protease
MTEDDLPPPRFTRRNARVGGSPFAWILPLGLTALVVALAWRLWLSAPRDLRDPGAQVQPVAARGDLAADEKATIELFRLASPAVVQVTNFRHGGDLTGSEEFEIPQGAGSGFVWNEKGYVVTNAHVVEKGDAFAVTFANHDTYEAAQVGESDRIHDLAVLKLDPKGKSLAKLPIGASRELVVGQKVFAIGNPFGLDQTLTTGIISGVGREIRSVLGTPIQNVIQTDAAINPGNSGGPLLDSAGRVIGVNTQIASPSGASAGVGFAIPIDTVNRIVTQIIQTGHIERAGLGIGQLYDGIVGRSQKGVIFGEYTTASAARAIGLRSSTLVEVENGFGPRRVAVRALGDVIVKIDERPVETTADLFRILDSREIGQEVEVAYLRDGKERTAKVKLVAIR